MKDRLSVILPDRLMRIIDRTIPCGCLVEEIRIRKNRQAYLVVEGKNIILDMVATDDEMMKIIKIISHNSLYAYRDTISNGYIPLENGIRVGLVGRASIENGNVVGVYDISEFSIRVPNRLRVDCSSIIGLAQSGSVLIYSPPGEGKTTLLRSMIRCLSGGIYAKRVGVIDTRNELIYDLDSKDLLVSILSGYPRKLGIEIAVRTMNSQLIVCDEIGDEHDAFAIIDAQGAGVPIIASCHGSSLLDIFSHTGIAKLHRAKIFDYYIGIKRSTNRSFLYNINTWEEADDYI